MPAASIAGASMANRQNAPTVAAMVPEGGGGGGATPRTAASEITGKQPTTESGTPPVRRPPPRAGSAAAVAFAAASRRDRSCPRVASSAIANVSHAGPGREGGGRGLNHSGGRHKINMR